MRAFASDLSETAQGLQDGIRVLGTDAPDLLGYEIDGAMTQEGVKRVIEPLEQAMKKDRDVSLLVPSRNLAGFDPRIMTSAGFMATEVAAAKSLRRYAVVGPAPWMNTNLEMADPAVPAEIMNCPPFRPDSPA